MASDLDAVGAPAGQAVLKGCEMVDVNSPDILAEIEALANKVLSELSDPLYDFIKENPDGVPPSKGMETDNQPQDDVSEPLSQSNTVDAPPTDYDPLEQADWDDVPF